MSVVTLVSGGLDSALLAVMVKEQGIQQYPLFVDYGQLCKKSEWQSCKELHKQQKLPPPQKINLSGFGKIIQSGLTTTNLDVKDDAFLPGRNLLFLLVGSGYAFKKGADAVAIGLLNEDVSIFPDQTNDFLEKAQNTISYALGRQIKVLAPLMMFSKGDIITLASERNITNTYSCHSGSIEPCGVCISCLEFKNARAVKGVN